MSRRVCTICKTSKTISEFHKYNRGPDGYRVSCKICVNEAQAKRDRIKRWRKQFELTQDEKIANRRKRALEGF